MLETTYAERMRQELVSAEEIADLVALRATGRDRIVVGIVGAPGAGKSTLAAELVGILDARGTPTALLPMDGFHLQQAELVRLGRRDRMGAADTFDVAGYLAMLRAVRTATSPVLAPGFDRDVEEPVPGAIRIPPTARVVITEGNWLLLREDGWSEVAALLDLTIAVAVDDAIRVPRLAARHVAHGKSPAAAAAWVERSDEANAARILPTLALADVIVRLP
jgi:pantothenate kinase